MLKYIIPSKIPGPASVDDRIHSGIKPSEPGDNGDNLFRIVNAGRAEGGQEISHEEREPTGYKDAHHNT